MYPMIVKRSEKSFRKMKATFVRFPCLMQLLEMMAKQPTKDSLKKIYDSLSKSAGKGNTVDATQKWLRNFAQSFKWKLWV